MLKQFAKIKKIQHFIAENQLYFESFVCKKMMEIGWHTQTATHTSLNITFTHILVLANKCFTQKLDFSICVTRNGTWECKTF